MIRTLCTLLFFISVSAGAETLKEKLRCNGEDDMCSDPCVFLKNKDTSIIFNPDVEDPKTYQGAPLISINGKITKLKLLQSSQYLSKVPRDVSAMEVKGDRRVQVYGAKNVRLEYKATVIDTSCSEKNELGIYESVDKCCSTGSRASFKVFDGTKTHIFNNVLLGSGC